MGNLLPPSLPIGPAEIIMALAAINFAASAAFGIDKALAENRARRVSEAALLQLALFGEIGGAYTGRALFRHKTRKQPFSNQLHLIAALQLCGGVFLTIFLW
ncbi:MAG: DUF1294 domain-containing protein [Pseudomonadota bacterium]